MDKIQEIVKFATNMKNHSSVPPVWCHGHTNWKYDETNNVYYNHKHNTIEFCLGDRYIYFTTEYGITNIRGSSSNNWHGYSFDTDLKKALNWVKETTYSDLGFLLWTGK